MFKGDLFGGLKDDLVEIFCRYVFDLQIRDDDSSQVPAPAKTYFLGINSFLQLPALCCTLVSFKLCPSTTSLRLWNLLLQWALLLLWAPLYGFFSSLSSSSSSFIGSSSSSSSLISPKL